MRSLFPPSFRWQALALVLAMTVPVCAARLTATQVLQNAAAHYDAIRDYVVDTTLSVESPSIHMPRTHIRIYYKKPDKIHFESDGSFAVLPKNGLLVGNPIRELVNGARLSLAGEERVSGIDCYVVKASFTGKDGRGVDSTVWVDRDRFLVVQTTANPDYGPTVKMKLKYRKVGGKYWMPSESVATITIPRIPGSDSDKSAGPPRPTIVTMRFSNYRVNTGLSDGIFKQNRGSD